MKKLKKTRAKLKPEEQILGTGVPDFLLNQDYTKKLKKATSKNKSNSKRK